jgi:hypothetical protein
MKRTSLVALLLLLFMIAMSGACIPFGDAWVNFSGHVKDSNGNPINGARLKIFFDGEARGDRSEAVTNENGEFHIFENSCPCDFEFLVVAAKDGFKIFSKKMRGRDANSLKEMEIILVRELT